jgi:hypothetical protein
MTEMNQVFRFLPAVLAVTALLGGCALAPTMGDHPDAVAPQLVANGADLAAWDRPGAFGKISGTLKATGDAACMAARVDLEALGYHPGARDDKGQPLPGGGFYCYPKRNGEQPDALAPRLVQSMTVAGDAPPVTSWDRPAAFGKVPAQLQARGDAACMLAGIGQQAIAYHPQAQGVDGQTLAGGGFFCAPKKSGDRPDDVAPRLVRVDGVLGWDRPAAFGAVPPALRSRGNAVCASVDAQQQAIGYHPVAQDEKGQPIQGGGFFCAAKPATRAVARA